MATREDFYEAVVNAGTFRKDHKAPGGVSLDLSQEPDGVVLAVYHQAEEKKKEETGGQYQWWNARSGAAWKEMKRRHGNTWQPPTTESVVEDATPERPTVTAATARETLSKLCVKPGFKPDERPAGAYQIGFSHSREDSAFIVSLRLSGSSREGKMRLDKDDTETKGRSMWMGDNNWRLTEKGIAKVLASMVTIGAVKG